MPGNTPNTDTITALHHYEGHDQANAARTVFLDTPNRRAIALIGTCSARPNRRISAQSSTEITLHHPGGVNFQPSLPSLASSLRDLSHHFVEGCVSAEYKIG